MIVTTAVTFILPESYCSTARIKVESFANTNAYDPYFIQTEFEIIRSQLILERVVEKLDLNTQWGKKYFNGELLKSGESLEILKGRISLAPVRSTKLIAISVYSDERNEAALIANEIARTYKDYTVERKYSSGPAEIIDQAEPARTPCKPNKTVNLVLGAVFGILMGGVSGALVWGFSSRRR